MNIGLFKGRFMYNVVDNFIDELAYAFEDRGHKVYIFNLADFKKKNFIESSSEIMKCNLDLMVKFNGIDFQPYSGFYEDLDIICGTILVDHPFFHYERLKNYSIGKNNFVTVYDEGTLELIDKYIDNRIICTQLLHGGTYSSTGSIEKKKYDVIFAGGINQEYTHIERFISNIENSKIKSLAKHLWKMKLENWEKTLYELWEQDLSKFELNQEELIYFIEQIYTQIDVAVRSYCRYKVISSLLKAKIKINYFGECKIDEFNNDINFINNGNVDYKKLLEIMSESKIIVHDTPYFRNGSHERIFSSMLNGALVFSNKNNYSFNMYKDQESIIYYSLDNLEELAEKIKYYLNNDDARRKITDNALKITREYNTWGKRADEILEIYNIVRNQ